MTERFDAPVTITGPEAPAAGEGATPPGAEGATPAAGEGATPAAAPTRPAWLPEKFKSAEDMARAYAELEKKQGSAAPVEPAPTAKPAATGELTSADLDKYSEAYAKNDGKLDDASYAELAARGVTKEMADMLIEGQVALAERARAGILAEAGVTEDEYSMLAEWARVNWTPERVAAFDAAIVKSPEASAPLIASLKSAYEAAEGQPPGNTESAAPGSPSEGPFPSAFAFTEAIRDSRYQTDPDYRDSVLRRAAMGVGK